ncbi:MAG: AsmA family protein [Candidatus Binatia bacterium]
MSRKLAPLVLLMLASLLVVLGVSLNSIVAKNRGRIQEELERSFGRAVAFGELKLSFWRGPGISAKDLRIAEDPHFAATPFIQTKELRMRLRWLPLLAGKFEIDKFILDGPEIQIIRNETGALNIAGVTAHEKKPREPGEAREKKGSSAPSFSVTAVSVNNGSVDYIDRSSREPVEIRVRRLDLDAGGIAQGETAHVKISGALFEHQGRNLRVDGKLGPWTGEMPWRQVPLDLKLGCDSLLLTQLTRAVPALRIPFIRYLDATGPVAIRTKLRGTFERPRLADLHLTGPLFGANEANTTVQGELDFSRAASWSEGEIQTKIIIDPLLLDPLRAIPFFRQALPAALMFEGPVGVSGDMRGRLDDLKIRATVKAGRSEIVYGNWLKKAKGIPAVLELNLERRKERLLVHESSVAIYQSKMKFSGALDELPERSLTLRLTSDGMDLAGWDKLLVPLSRYNTAGKLRWDLSIKKHLAQEGVEISGALVLDNVQAKEKRSGRGIEQATARVAFHGTEARVEHLVLRSGSSDIAVEGAVADLSQPTFRYSLRSAKLNLGDLTPAAAYKADEMKSLAGSGELLLKDGKILVRGQLSSAEGTVQKVVYRNLRGEAAWSPGLVTFKNFSFQALNGNFRANGAWETAGQNSFKLALEPGIESVDFRTLLAQKFPLFKERIDGQLNLKARLKAESKTLEALPKSLAGQGETQLRNGSLKDFNLMQLVFANVSGLPGIAKLRVPARFAALAQNKDTPFESLTATFTVKQGRIYSKDLLLATADYNIMAEGSIGLDQTMKWEAMLLMSPQFTQELVQEFKNARYLVDRRGRLVVPFRAEGKLPRVQAKPDLQKLAQQMQKGFATKGADRAPEESDKQPRKTSRRER